MADFSAGFSAGLMDERLARISFVRAAGTGAEGEACDMLASSAASAGLVPVREAFGFRHWRETLAEVEVMEPYRKRYRAQAFPFMANTPLSGYQAPLSIVDRLDSRHLAGVNPGGIVLAGDVRLSAADSAACALGGFVFPFGSVADPLERAFECRKEWNPFPRSFDGLFPAVQVPMAYANEMAIRGASSARILSVSKEYEASSCNLIVDVPSHLSGAAWIVVGAHYDSVPEGVGARDNGSGTVIVEALMRHFSGHRLARNLRFVFFGAEERWLIGSWEYTKAHARELDSIDLMINVDVAGSPIGHNVAAISADDSLSSFVRQACEDFAWEADIESRLVDSDSTPFAAAGVPAVTFGRFAGKGYPTAHSYLDSPGYVSGTQLAIQAAFMARFIERVAGMSARFGRELPERLKSGLSEFDKPYGY